MPYLIALEGLLKDQRFPLEQQMLIGRCPEASVHLLDAMVTRRHCLISAGPDGYTIEDLGSRNGTFVNDRQIAQPLLLKHGDVIRIHNNVFRYAAMSADASSVILTDGPQLKTTSVVESVDIDKGGTSDLTDAAKEADAFATVLKRLKTVVEVSNAVCGELDTDGLLERMMNSFFKVFPQVERGFIMLRDTLSGKLDVKHARHRGAEKDWTISVSRHVIDEAVRQRAGILSGNAMDDSRFSGAVSVMDFQIRSMMCAPLIAKDELLGVIHLDTATMGQHFTREDLELFTLIANQAALVISNTRMHEQLRKRQAMEQDLAMARHVQHSFLPGGLPEIPGMEFSATYRAALEVGGDFYDFIPLQDGRLGIVLGDVMGKGMYAALMMVRIMGEVRYLATSDPEPASVLRRLNESLNRRRTENTFVTGVFMVLDPKTRELVVSNAAHYPPVVHRAGADQLIEVNSVESGLPLGSDEHIEYLQEAVFLQPGDTILTFTDGVTEAENADEEMYGTERLYKAVNVADTNPDALMKHVLEDIRQFVGDTPQSDDLTVLTFGVTK